MRKYVLLLVAVMTVAIARSEMFEVDGIRYSTVYNDNSKVRVFGCEKAGLVEIPSIVVYENSRYLVTEISMFSGNKEVTSVVIPNSVTRIGSSAFSGCTELATINLPESITEIEYRAFENCSSLTSISIPNSVTSIESHLFSGCSSLTAVTIPDAVTSIGGGAFYGCSNLTAVTIPDAVTSIGYSAFSGCSNLATISLPDKITSIESGTFKDCSSLSAISIPNAVTSIKGTAFSGCSNLATISIPGAVESIVAGAFTHCGNLKEINVDSDNENFASENGILLNKAKTQLISYPGARTEVTLPASVTSIGNDACSGCDNLVSIEIPESVTELGDYAFSDCSNLNSVIIPGSITAISKYCFKGCAELETIELPESLRQIGDNAFQVCNSLVDISIPDNVYTIGKYAFSSCKSLTSISLPQSLKSLNSNAFSGCTALTSISLPQNLKYLNSDAFSWCTSLKRIYDYNPTPQTEPEDVPFENIVVYVPKGSLSQYIISWKNFTDFREIGAFDITLSDYTQILSVGASAEIVATVENDGSVTVKTEKWYSSDTNVATVENGKVTAVKPGTAIITFEVSTAANPLPNKESCVVTVVEGVPVESIELNQTSINAEVGSEIQLSVTVKPDNAANKTISWSSSDSSIASVDQDGLVKILKVGHCTITAATTDGSDLKAECEVNGIAAGIEDIVSETNSPVAVYNLQGSMVMTAADASELRALPAGIYILRQGTKTDKIVVK